MSAVLTKSPNSSEHSNLSSLSHFSNSCRLSWASTGRHNSSDSYLFNFPYNYILSEINVQMEINIIINNILDLAIFQSTEEEAMIDW